LKLKNFENRGILDYELNECQQLEICSKSISIYIFCS